MPASSMCWWLEELDRNERARRMVNAQKVISDLPSEGIRRDRDIDNVRLYEADPSVTLFNFAGAHYADAGAAAFSPVEDSTNNKAKAAIDTLLSQVTTTDQRSRFCVVDGSYKQRRRARELQNFSDGLSHELKLHKWKKRAAKDAAILQSGVGALQFYRRNGRCAVQRIIAPELTIDPADGMIDGQWMTIYRKHPVPRDQVKADFGDNGALLDELIDSQNVKAVVTAGAPSDNVDVYEAWHLPSEEGAGDGWHVIALDVEGGTLLVEPYKKMFHEIVFFSWEDRFTTGWGLSPMTQARKLQRRINANSYRVDRAQKLFHAGHIYIDKSKAVTKSKLSNEIGTAWEGNGPNGIQQILFNAVTAEMYNQIERDGQRIFENLGISQSASQGETDRGLDASAAAMREETKKSDRRNSSGQQRWEQFGLDCDRVALSVVRDIVTGSKEDEKAGAGGDSKKTRRKRGSSDYRVAVPGKRGLTVVDWNAAAIDEKDYVIVPRSASPIPTDPAGLVAFGERMVEIGAWKPSQLAGYMQDLDADGRINRGAAQERRLEEMFESLLYDDISVAVPDEFTNIAMAMEIGLDYLAQGEEDKVPEKHLERVRRYLKRCKALAAQASAAQAQVQGQTSQNPAADAPAPVAAAA